MEPVTLLGKGYDIKKSKNEVSIQLPDSFRKAHFWCFGTTRVGKTRLLENMVEQDIRKGYNCVVFDPKGDTDLCSKIIQIAFEENRHQDLILVNPIHPEYSAKIDPLAYYYMPEELVSHICSGVDATPGESVFFFNVAYEISLVVVQALIMLANHLGRPPIFNLNDVKNLVSQNEIRRLKEQIDTIGTPEAAQLSGDMQKILDRPADYFSKVSSSLAVALMELTSGNIGKIIGKADENRFLKRLNEGQGVIMIAQLGSLITRKAAYTLGKVLLSMIQSYVGRIFAAGGKADPPLCVYLDEAHSLLFRGVEELFAKAGGADVWVHGFCQSVNQLYSTIGKDFANTILDNTNTKVFMRVPDATTAEYVAVHFGVEKKYSPIMHVGGAMAARETEEDVIRPQDILSLPAREFYLFTYNGALTGSGMFHGKTLPSSAPWLEVVPPPITHAE